MTKEGELMSNAEADLVSETGARYSSAILHDAGVYEREQERIFGRCWQFVAHESQIPDEGDFFQSRMGEDSVIVTRSENGRVNVMLNVCRHRGHVVCRADSGNSKRFVCPYHAWTYGPDGALLNAPMTRELAPGFDKSEFGLVHVPRVERYRGLIFANFDEDAPPLLEELGPDFLFYLETFLHRREADLVLIGGVQKWEVECNWKIGPEGMGGDFYHVASAHASTLSGSVELRDSINAMSDPSVARNISFEGGHGFNTFMLPENAPADAFLPVEPRYLHIPEVREYFEGLQAEADVRLGATRRRLRITTGTMFPNLSFSPGIMTLRLILPKGPNKIENWCWVFGYRDMPEKVRRTMHLGYLSVFGPDGCLEPDDAEAWTLVTSATRTRRAQAVTLFAGLGEGFEEKDDTLPGTHHHPLSEGVSRSYFREWRRRMSIEGERAVR